MYFDHSLEGDEYVTEVTFKVSMWLDSITFTTNKGSVWKIGGEGGEMSYSIQIL